MCFAQKLFVWQNILLVRSSPLWNTWIINSGSTFSFWCSWNLLLWATQQFLMQVYKFSFIPTLKQQSAFQWALFLQLRQCNASVENTFCIIICHTITVWFEGSHSNQTFERKDVPHFLRAYLVTAKFPFAKNVAPTETNRSWAVKKSKKLWKSVCR